MISSVPDCDTATHMFESEPKITIEFCETYLADSDGVKWEVLRVRAQKEEISEIEG